MSHSILVIDDNELNLTLAQKILTLSGYEVGTAVRHAGPFLRTPSPIGPSGLSQSTCFPASAQRSVHWEHKENLH